MNWNKLDEHIQTKATSAIISIMETSRLYPATEKTKG